MDPLNKYISKKDADILLAKYVAGDTNADEYAKIKRWIADNEKNRKYAEQLQTIWEKSEMLAYSGTTNSQSAWEDFREKMTANRTTIVQQKLFARKWLYAAAAILLIAIICFGIFTWYPKKNHATILLHDFSGNHELIDTLSDGSIIILQANSSISYPAHFAAGQRNLTLVGDAFFLVHHDAEKPFRISVGEVDVTVLGTAFGITSSAKDIKVFVKTGVVAVTKKDKSDTLRANENLVVPIADSPWIKHADSFQNTTRQNVKTTDLPFAHPKIIEPTKGKPIHALIVGDKVPILPLDKWIKGGPLNIYEKGKVYLVDFWALWCGPCIAGMENLSALQKKYKNEGLEVIGVTSEDAWGNSYDKVTQFIREKRKKFDYNFAWLPFSYREDHKYKSIIYNPWLLLAYDSSSWALPQVFLIDRNGKFAFIGDGYNLREDFIKSVLQDTYDTAKERKEYILKLSLENQVTDFLSLLDEKNISAAINLGHTIVEDPLVNTHALLVISDDLFNKYKSIQSKELIALGFEAAKKGVKMTDSLSPSHLSVLAKGYSLINEPEQAVATIKSAIALSEGDFKEALEKDLKIYEQSAKKIPD